MPLQFILNKPSPKDCNCGNRRNKGVMRLKNGKAQVALLRIQSWKVEKQAGDVYIFTAIPLQALQSPSFMAWLELKQESEFTCLKS